MSVMNLSLQQGLQLLRADPLFQRRVLRQELLTLQLKREMQPLLLQHLVQPL